MTKGDEAMTDRICDLPPDKQSEIRSEVERAYQFFGYRGKQRERMVAKAMESDLGAVCNLIGAYHWAMDNDDVASGIICGKTADSAIQDTL